MTDFNRSVCDHTTHGCRRCKERIKELEDGIRPVAYAKDQYRPFWVAVENLRDLVPDYRQEKP